MKKILFLILAFFLPPVAVALLEGFTFHFWLNIVLWIIGFGVGGIIHAFFLILTRDYPAFH
jgi:uncharacterized membrane protein YqaE (UPF0057 family)